MNFQFYVEKLENSPEYKKFKTEFPDAFPCSCFFLVDKQRNDNKQHFDFFLPKEKKIMSFQLENNQIVPIQEVEKELEEISLKNDFDFNEIEKLIEQEMEKNKMKKDIQKMLFSLQRVNGKDYLIGTIFIPKLGMLKVNIDVKEKKITDFEKRSLLDMMNIFKKK